MVRAEGAALHASIGTMSGCLLNIVLDPIFILALGTWHGGRRGGACHLPVQLRGLPVLLCPAVLSSGRIPMSVCGPACSVCRGPSLLGVCGVGVPAAVQNLLNVTGMTVLNNFTSAFGSDAVAAMGIAQKINMVPMYIAMGLSQGVMPLVSYTYASGDITRMKGTVMFSARISRGLPHGGDGVLLCVRGPADAHVYAK